jgi:hypothetical protein
MLLPLGPEDALYEVTLLPADSALPPLACSSAGIEFEAVHGAVSFENLGWVTEQLKPVAREAGV